MPPGPILAPFSPLGATYTASLTFNHTRVEDQARYDGFGIAWFDYNDDGKPELIVANDSTPNYLCRNRGDGTFEDVSYVSGTALDENGREQAQLSCRC